MTGSGVDIAINLIAAFGIGALLFSMSMRNADSPVERRLFSLVLAIVLTLALRAVFWADGGYFWESVALLPAIATPLLGLVTTEGVLRRHAPFLLKAFAAAGLALAVIVALAGHRPFEPGFSIALFTYQSVIVVFCLCWIAARKRQFLSAAENRFADIFAATLLLVAPLLATDFPAVIDLPARLGAIGLLAAAYVYASAWSPKFSIGETVLKITIILACAAGFLWLAVGFLGLDDWRRGFQFGAVLVAIALAAGIVFQLMEAFAGARRRGVTDIITSARTDSISAFLEDALSPEGLKDAVVCDERVLADYDQSIRDVFSRKPIMRLRDLTGVRAEGAAREQLAHLLRRHQASHAVLLRDRPLLIVLTSAPPFSDEHDLTAHLHLLRKLAHMIDGGKAREEPA